jgi:ATP-dependent RNA helicase UAP56/SUB2
VDEGKLTLRGVHQYYYRIEEAKKFEKLMHFLDTLPFNQVIIFANKIERVKKICYMLKLKFFNPICIHSQLKQEERIKNYDLFKEGGSKLLVATDLFGRGIDVQSVNFVINYDFPNDRHTYLHRVGRAGRFNTRALVINFIRLKTQGE